MWKNFFGKISKENTVEMMDPQSLQENDGGTKEELVSTLHTGHRSEYKKLKEQLMEEIQRGEKIHPDIDIPVLMDVKEQYADAVQNEKTFKDLFEIHLPDLCEKYPQFKGFF